MLKVYLKSIINPISSFFFTFVSLFIIENKEQPAATTPPPLPAKPSPSSSITSEPKSGVLVIRVIEARDITPPSNVTLPASQHVPVQRTNRDSLTRKQNWWLPYVVLEFDKNEVLIDSLGGDSSNPIYQYNAHL